MIYMQILVTTQTTTKLCPKKNTTFSLRLQSHAPQRTIEHTNPGYLACMSKDVGNTFLVARRMIAMLYKCR